MIANLPPQLEPNHSRAAAPTRLGRPSRWLNVLSHLDPKYGGLSTVVPQLCASVDQSNDALTELAAFCLPQEECFVNDISASQVSHWPMGRLRWLADRKLQAAFRAKLSKADGVHIHGLWEQSTNIAARAARALGKPYLLSAHGMLESWALNNKAWKKRAYSALFEHANVRGAACLHALTDAEAADYRRFGATGPIVVIPNAVQIQAALEPELFLSKFPSLRGKRLILFLGRIHFKKGLDILVEAWARVARQWPEAHLVLAGPDFENTQRGIQQSIDSTRIANHVTFTGMLTTNAKWSALAAAHCFVLPSYSEGLSASVLEAMGAGLPVIVTHNCNIPDVTRFHAGWEVEADADALTEALVKFLTSSESANKALGERGRHLVHSSYNPSVVGCRMARLYGWIAGGCDPQSFDVGVNCI